MGGCVEVALAADVQTGVVVDADELGAGGAFTVVVVQRLPCLLYTSEIRQAAANAGIGLSHDYDTTFFRFADYRTGAENTMRGTASGCTSAFCRCGSVHCS